MRSFIVMGMLISSLAMAEYKGYTEARTLELATDDISVFELDTGAGSLVIKGVEDANMIRVNAVVRIDEDDQDKAQKVIESDMTLALVESRSRAKLTADFDSGFWRGNEDRAIDLEIEVPTGLELIVDDGAGSIDIEDVLADIYVDDGSGSITMRNVGNVRIDDGSGSIQITVTAGDVSIDDGSGGITVTGVGGSVTIDDGSGSIDVSDVELDLIIVDDGSGGLHVRDVRGTVKNDNT